MFAKLAAVEARYVELESLLVEPGIIGNRKEFAKLGKERSGLEEIVHTYRAWKELQEQIEGNKSLLHDADEDVRALAQEELPGLKAENDALEARLKVLLLPRDPNDDRNVLLEIRAGTGGEEASLFAAQLFRMYTRYAEARRWRVEILSSSETGIGGMKEIVASIEGQGAYSRLKFEGGVHRVQRVPATEASGRIHTSAVTVAVLPEADEIDVQIDDKDLKIDVFRSSGPGGQSVNTTDSAVRVTHIPSGFVVSCQDEKSQLKNKAKALKILRARLLERAQAEQQAEIAASRKSMVGTGDRSERIRTYNFPQSRVSDHRINLTLHSLDKVLEGDLDPLIDALITHYQAEALKTAH
ncbi:MAG: peptide chain release factor 1 [Myxococcales bacterium]|jgi:peptide chain release factor 1|nr:peptide chain release factor 1 [Myxococcales bacterium]